MMYRLHVQQEHNGRIEHCVQTVSSSQLLRSRYPLLLYLAKQMDQMLLDQMGHVLPDREWTMEPAL